MKLRRGITKEVTEGEGIRIRQYLDCALLLPCTPLASRRGLAYSHVGNFLSSTFLFSVHFSFADKG